MSDFKNEKIYYDINKLLSHNKLLNISIGARGLGKSYAAKRLAINNFLKHKKQFIYVRRYKNEFDNIKNYFSDIEDRYPDHQFDVGSGCFYIDGEVAGYYIALSTSQKQKSSSFPEVSLIIFDEFIVDKGRVSYIKGEVEVFLDLIETVARTRDDVRVVMISNAISSINPYFLYFNIYPHSGDKFISKDQVIVEINKNLDFVNFKKQTKFGQLIADSKYGKYSIENEFLRDDNSFIEKMSGKSICWYGIKYEEAVYSIWYNQPSGFVFVTKKALPNSNYDIYSILTEDHRPNMLLISKSNQIFKKLKEAYSYGQVRFDSLQAKTTFLEYLDLL